MTNDRLRTLQVLWPVLFWGAIIGVPVALYCLGRACKRLPQLLLWIAAPILVWVSLMQVHTCVGYPIGRELAKRAGDTLYDGTGAGAAMCTIGLPLGLVSTAVVFGIGWGVRKALQRKQGTAEPDAQADGEDAAA